MLKKKFQNNFSIIDNRIAQMRDLSFEARGLYFYMTSLPDDWEFSEARLADAGNVGIDKIKRIIKELIHKQLLKRDFFYNEKGHKKAIYTLFDLDTTLENPTLENPMNYKEINIQRNNNKEIIIKEKNIIKKEKSQNALILKTNYNFDEEFNLFYEIYPRKKSKARAKLVFEKLRKGTHKNFKGKRIPLDNILNSLSNFIQDIGEKGTKIEFIPYPATWLNDNDFVNHNDKEFTSLPQDNKECLFEIETMLKNMADVMNQKFKENPNFKLMPEYKLLRRELIFNCILKIKEICFKHKVIFYKYFGLYDENRHEHKKYKWYLEKSFSDWLQESLKVN